MTNEKLGVLLVDVPEPRMTKYSVLISTNGKYRILDTDSELFVRVYGCRCTKEEAVKHSQFRWVALEELT